MKDQPVTKEARDYLLLKMAFWLMFTALAIVSAIIWIPIPPSGQDAAKYTVGFLFGTLLGTLITNLYGTSQSSKDKDTTIKEQNVSMRNLEEGKELIKAEPTIQVRKP